MFTIDAPANVRRDVSCPCCREFLGSWLKRYASYFYNRRALQRPQGRFVSLLLRILFAAQRPQGRFVSLLPRILFASHRLRGGVADLGDDGGGAGLGSAAWSAANACSTR